MSESEYLLTNVDPETVERFQGLEHAFDPLTTDHLARTGVTSGWRCLEIGTGGGSIARWMAARVGPTGRVVAVDLDTRWFQHDGSSQLEVRELDLVADPVPTGPWDLIHERLVLQHIPERLAVLDRLVASLAPGGWIVLEDFDTGEVRTIDRAGPHHEFLAKMRHEFNKLLASRGGVSDFGANSLRLLRDRGLVDAGGSGHVVISTGGSDYTRVISANFRQVREGLVAQGVPPEDIDRYLELLADPDTILETPVLMTAWGRRPSSHSAATRRHS
ncbi:MAG TPA: methyltransferase domain-containing protein [Acidimicrobiales bacterium]|nr:methyltransferase domain-containing protein [Acidimicrobiales bacterium]